LARFVLFNVQESTKASAVHDTGKNIQAGEWCNFPLHILLVKILSGPVRRNFRFQCQHMRSGRRL
jgi:hypothetical protein